MYYFTYIIAALVCNFRENVQLKNLTQYYLNRNLSGWEVAITYVTLTTASNAFPVTQN